MPILSGKVYIALLHVLQDEARAASRLAEFSDAIGDASAATEAQERARVLGALRATVRDTGWRALDHNPEDKNWLRLSGTAFQFIPVTVTAWEDIAQALLAHDLRGSIISYGEREALLRKIKAARQYLIDRGETISA